MSHVHQDKLQLARAKFLEQIMTKETEIRALREKLALIDEVEDLFKDSNKEPGSQQKYANMKLTKALLDAVQILGTNGGVAATDVRRYVEGNGYRHPNPKNFPVATVIALNRLGEQGKIISEKTDGRRLFKAKK